MQDFHCYQLPQPIDDFTRCLDFKDYCSKLSNELAYEYFMDLMDAVIVLAYKSKLLEMPTGIYFMSHGEGYDDTEYFPSSLEYAYILKQQSDGLTHVVSRLPIPSLAAHELVHCAKGFNPFETPHNSAISRRCSNQNKY